MRGRAAGGVVAGRFLRLDQRHTAIRRERGRDRGTGDAGADDHHVELIRVHSSPAS